MKSIHINYLCTDRETNSSIEEVFKKNEYFRKKFKESTTERSFKPKHHIIKKLSAVEKYPTSKSVVKMMAANKKRILKNKSQFL